MTDKQPTDIARYADAHAFLAAAAKTVIEDVYVPSIDMNVRVKGLNAAEVQRARADIVERKNGVNVPREDRDFSAMIVFYATVNADGSPFFQRGMVEALNTSLYAAIQPIAKVALRLSGLDDEAEEAMRKKHFERTRSDV